VSNRGQIVSSRHRLARLQANDWLAVVGLSVIVAALFAMFHHWGNTTDVRLWGRSAFGWLITRWGDSGPSLGGGDYSHGVLIPIITIGLIWFRRHELGKVAKSISYLGLAAVVAALLLHYVGAKGQQTRLTLFAMIGLIWAIPTYLFGLRVGLLLLFPCAYLIFAVPFDFLGELATFLQGIMTSSSAALLNALGLPVTQVGNQLFGDGYSFNVDVPCSGIRSLQALTALTAIYAYLTQSGLVRKWLLFLSAFPLAVIGNMARVISVVLVAEGFDAEFASGTYHDMSGGVRGGGGVDGRGRGFAEQTIQRKDVPMEQARRRLPHIGVILLLVLGTIWALATSVETTASDRAGVARELPVVVLDRTGGGILYCHNRDVHGPVCPQFEGRESSLTHCSDPRCGEELFPMELGEKIMLPPSTDIYKKRYRREGDSPITASIVLAGEDRASFHRPSVCIGAQGFQTLATRKLEVPLDGRKPLRIKVYDLTLSLNDGEDHHSYFAFWYVGTDRETASHYERMFWMGYDRIVRSQADRWAYVSITGLREPEGDKHIEELTSFIQDLYPKVRLDEDGQ